MKKTALKRISKKHQEQLPEYYVLVNKLYRLCGNRSELSGKAPDWQSWYQVEPHHIDGRMGKLFTDPFNIIMLTRDEHTAIEEERSSYTKEDLSKLIKPKRIKQGFKEV